MCKAIGNPIRFEILKFLLSHPSCITGDIVNHVPIAQATVSQHLKVLKESGWIQGESEGSSTCYCMSDAGVQWFKQTIGEIF
ncbi:Arsenical resistance operon repressor [Salinispira pacifica]|uniref:Arsenical resistance operon repressor n=2 Tax=Salinispira pacifica TaxID=1307761 RepID=V5WEU6_9SPIO|nr:Arsenical resistance operon repressor [Salinispira pacifica]